MALHTAALDPRVSAAAAFGGWTPMRTDTAARPTGGIRRLFEMHALLPRLGLFAAGRDRVDGVFVFVRLMTRAQTPH